MGCLNWPFVANFLALRANLFFSCCFSIISLLFLKVPPWVPLSPSHMVAGLMPMRTGWCRRGMPQCRNVDIALQRLDDPLFSVTLPAPHNSPGNSWRDPDQRLGCGLQAEPNRFRENNWWDPMNAVGLTAVGWGEPILGGKPAFSKNISILVSVANSLALQVNGDVTYGSLCPAICRNNLNCWSLFLSWLLGSNMVHSGRFEKHSPNHLGTFRGVHLPSAHHLCANLYKVLLYTPWLPSPVGTSAFSLRSIHKLGSI